MERILEFRIYSRWGGEVFIAEDFLPNDPNIGWDGTKRGKLMNTGVFAYFVRAQCINGEEILEKGDISLLR